MGMYTELSFNAELEIEDENVVEVLRFMTNNGAEPEKKPDHEFFTSDRWKYLFFGSSYYFPNTIKPVFRYDDISADYRLTTRSNIKNYDDEIFKFLNWILPYVVDGVGRGGLYAQVCYEEAYEPTNYYLNEDREEI